jgi:hypothetical protein
MRSMVVGAGAPSLMKFKRVTASPKRKLCLQIAGAAPTPPLRGLPPP